MAGDIDVTSKAFDDGEPVPERYTCDDADVSPPLSWTGAPDDAAAFALVADDPDAPGGTFTHWLVWNLPADVASLAEDVPKRHRVDQLDGAVQGSNDFGKTGYNGPCPPKGDGDHTYRFTVLALDEEVDLSPGRDRGAFDEAIDGLVRAKGRLTGTYGR